MEPRPDERSADVPQLAVATKCPLTAALIAIGGKWNLICLYWLDSGTRRFNELRRLMPDISHKVLAATLRSLEQEGLICRTVYAEVPPRVEYRISGHGETVRPILQSVRVWGQEHLEWKRLENETEQSKQA
ncbi:MAG: helix-turn-helix transcriptional regulator [Acidobacteriia bacterium]|nr:helix-turn-helix transcriptional regulator [Terriglobia bacterium]